MRGRLKERSAGDRRPRLLLLAQFPPPMHGSAYMAQIMVDSHLLREAFDLHHCDISTSRHASDIGHFAPRKALTIPRLGWRLIRQLRGKQYDLVVLTLSLIGLGFYKDFIVGMVVKLSGHRIVYYLHRQGVRKESERSSLKRYLYRSLFRGSRVIHLSPLLYRDIALFVREEDVLYVANGVPSQQDGGIPRESETGSVVRVLYLGTMRESKGVLYLLRACERLRTREVVCSMLFAGSWGGERDFEERFWSYVHECHLENVVEYLGERYGEEKRRLLNDVDVFVLPTVDDAFPLVILEAMSCAVPIVATREGAIPEMIDGRCGRLVEKGDVEGLARELEGLITDPSRRREMGRQARMRYEARFSAELFEGRIKDALERLLKREHNGTVGEAG